MKRSPGPETQIGHHQPRHRPQFTMQALRAPSPFVQHQQGSCRKAPVASRAALLVPRAAAEPQQSTPQSADRRTALLGLAALAASAGWSGAVPQVRALPPPLLLGSFQCLAVVTLAPDCWPCGSSAEAFFCLPPFPSSQLAYAGNPAPVKEYLPAAEGLPGFCIYTPGATASHTNQVPGLLLLCAMVLGPLALHSPHCSGRRCQGLRLLLATHWPQDCQLCVAP